MSGIKPGTKLQSTVCDTVVMIIKTGEFKSVMCGGEPMIGFNVENKNENSKIDSAFADGTIMGKRYVNADQSFEALCIKPGGGSLSIDQIPLVVKQAKILPSSD